MAVGLVSGYPDPYRDAYPSDLEPVSGFEPLTCRLQEVRPRALCALAARMARVMALMAPAALGLSGAPVHEPVHAQGPYVHCPATECNLAAGTVSMSAIRRAGNAEPSGTLPSIRLLAIM